MKTLKKVTAIFLVLCLAAMNVVAQWQQLNTGINTHLKSVFFIDENIGYAAGGSIILKTTDGGQNWNAYSLNENLNTVFFTSADTGYVAGFGIYKTTDGGQNWNHIFSPANSGYSNYFNAIYFTNSQTGYLASGDFTPVLKTADAGTTWIELPTMSTSLPLIIGYHYLNSIHFPDKNTGYAVGGFNNIANTSGVLIKTTDEGTSWDNIFGFESGNPRPDMDITSVFFTDPQKGWIAGSKIFHTTDGGATWDTVNYPLNNGINDIFFVNEFIGFTVQYNGDIYYTKNGGQSWQNENAPSDNSSVNDIFCISGVCYAVGDNGVALKRNVLINSIDEKQTSVFNIFPNPSSGNITISVSGNERSNDAVFITITDVYGKEVFRSGLSDTSTYDFSHFQNGIYFVYVHNGKETQTKKLLLLNN